MESWEDGWMGIFIFKAASHAELKQATGNLRAILPCGGKMNVLHYRAPRTTACLMWPVLLCPKQQSKGTTTSSSSRT